MLNLAQLGLKTRTIAGCALLLLLTVCALSTALIHQDYVHALQNLNQYATNQAQSVAYSAEPYVLLDEKKALWSVLKAGASDQTLCSGLIVDTSGRVLSLFRRNAQTPKPVIDLKQPIPGHISHDTVRVERSENQLMVVAPIWSGTSSIQVDLPELEQSNRDTESRVVGYVVLLYSMDSVHAQLSQGLLSAVIISAGVLCAGLAVTILLVRQFLKPVENLVQTVQAIKRGDLSKRASTDAAPEISILARAFNQMADSLSNYTQDLEEQVRRRTAALQASEAEARQLAVAAESASHAKSEFLANMSHEIRTPMTAILGFAESLDSGLSDVERREAVCTIRRNGEHLLQIINDILDISKIEAGKYDLEVLPCSPVDIISEVASLMRVRAESKGLNMSVEYKGSIPDRIETDVTRLRQVLINLLGNAIKFTEQGSVRLEVQFQAEDPSNPRIAFSVIDTGFGMNSEQVSNLFRPFTQVDSSMTRRFGGTGLGLAISKRITDLLGGTILVDSQPGVGSTFTLVIPTGPLAGARMLEQPAEAMANPPAHRRVPATQPLPHLNCRVLLVEDGPDNQRLISFLLRKAGAEVDVAENGRVGVETALAAEHAGKPYDVILMDMQMPVLDGYAASRLLRQREYRGPIIALTAHAMAGDREKCVEAGCDDYATKPINRQLLLETIVRHLPTGSPEMSNDNPELPPLVSELAGDSDLADLVELFVSELPQKVRALQAAMDIHEREQIRVLAHQLKGSAGGYGFPTITDAAKALEDGIKTQADVAELKNRFDSLIKLCQRASSEGLSGESCARTSTGS